MSGQQFMRPKLVFSEFQFLIDTLKSIQYPDTEDELEEKRVATLKTLEDYAFWIRASQQKPLNGGKK